MATAAEYRNWAEDYFKLAREAPDANVRVAYSRWPSFGLNAHTRLIHAGINLLPEAVSALPSLGDARQAMPAAIEKAAPA
jgi:hypothetical protein